MLIRLASGYLARSRAGRYAGSVGDPAYPWSDEQLSRTKPCPASKAIRPNAIPELVLWAF